MQELEFGCLGHLPEPDHAWVAAIPVPEAGDSGPVPPMRSDTSFGSSAIASRSTSSPLPRLVAPEEQHTATSAISSGRSEALEVDPVEQHGAGHAEVPVNEFGCGIGNGNRRVDAPSESPRRPPEPSIWRSLTSGMKGGDGRCGVEQQGRDRDARRKRLVEVDHVEPASVQRTSRSIGAGGVGRHPSDRPVHRNRNGPPQTAGRSGRQHRDPEIEPGQCSLEGEHLVLHASGGVEAVRTDQRNASNDAARPLVVGSVGHSTTAVRARSPSPMGRLFAYASVPWRTISSWVISVRRLPNSRSASGSRKLRLAPRST